MARDTVQNGVKAAFPKTVSPMLATLVDAPVDEPGWIYEIKWDGYRAISFCNKKNVSVLSRNKKSFSEKYYPIHAVLQSLNLSAVLDGEIVVINANGVSNFGALQNWRSEADGSLVYYVFDVLWLNGYDLTGLPLTRRRELLHGLLPKEGIIRESEIFNTTAAELLSAVKEIGLEGIIAKKADSVYKQNDRGRDWLKIKSHRRHEVVIGGYTKNEDSPKPFSSLLVGVNDADGLRYIGKIGTGFNERLQKELIAMFKPLEVKKSPFTITPDVNEPSRFRPNPPHADAFWLKPKLVCEVAYAELTADGIMRHPSFQGMREDKDAKDVQGEVPEHTEDIVAAPASTKKKREAAASKTKGAGATKAEVAALTGSARNAKGDVAKATASPIKLRGSKAGRGSLLNPTEETQVKSIGGHELRFTNLSKLFWPKEGFTKRDLLNYYYQVAEYILPYLKDRPQSLNRFPNGIEGKSFYNKDVSKTAEPWIVQFPYTTSEGEHKNYLVAENEASILWMANMGAIEMNPWNSRIQQPDNPDWCVIDIDPTEKNTFEQVIKVAQVTRQVLDVIKVPGYPKTSGSTGIHIYIPLQAKYPYETCQLFGKYIATRVHQELKEFTSIERMTNLRKGKIYIDYLQNRPKATLAAPYAVRPKPGATVSMPLHWEEIKKGLKMKQFTIANAVARIKGEGDLFKPVLGKGVNIEQALKRLEKL